MRDISYQFAFLLITFACTQGAFADVKIKSNQTMSGQSYENTTYIKGKRQRTETMNDMMVNITQCDLRCGIRMNPAAKTFLINAFAEAAATTAKPASAKQDGVVQAGGRITTTITVKDTGERKQMFGFTARHLIITMDTVSSPDACSKSNYKMQTDDWYIDFEPQFNCDQTYAPRQNYNSGKAGGCQDKYDMKQVGTAKRGYPVYEKMTMFDDSGKETMSYVNEVLELSKAPLNAGLFDVPEGYREVQDAAQLYSAANYSGNSMGNGTSSAGPNSGIAQTLKNAASASPTSDRAVGPKKEGMIRIGLSGVKTGPVDEGIAAADLSAAIQNTLINYLKVPNVEVVTLDAKLSSAIDSEARQKECDYVIYATASHKKGGGGFGGMFGSALGAAVGRVGIGHTGSTVGNIAGQVATQAIVSAGTVSGNVRSKDEISLDLKLNQTGGGLLWRRFTRRKPNQMVKISSPL